MILGSPSFRVGSLSLAPSGPAGDFLAPGRVSEGWCWGGAGLRLVLPRISRVTLGKTLPLSRPLFPLLSNFWGSLKAQSLVYLCFPVRL